ncbi:uncharacterized protein EV154DRAFT_519355 [Mucor mucedo]|uniref:uncharacterized protein n=1 Tax=Mucor mucedo TaxID=29922 RepID=UPI00221EB1B0|nr:uncharacterized protein EV154DRAFT_519355 [Mucor mucedo]KAI7887945.1 hypothetical protein EV154DRAFT_519355 [Mucor mucedo]
MSTISYSEMVRREKAIILEAMQESTNRLKECFPNVTDEKIGNDLARRVQSGLLSFKVKPRRFQPYYVYLRKYKSKGAIAAAKDYKQMTAEERERWNSYYEQSEQLLTPTVQRSLGYRFRTRTDYSNFHRLKALLEKIGRESEAHVVCAVVRKVVGYNRAHYVISGTEAGEGFLQEYEDRNGGSLSSNLEYFAERHKSVEEGQGPSYKVTENPPAIKQKRVTTSKHDMQRQDLREAILLLISMLNIVGTSIII